MNTKPEVYKSLPAVSRLLTLPEVKLLIDRFGDELVKFAIRHSIEYFRSSVNKGNPAPTPAQIVEKINSIIALCGNRSLKKVINASGIIIHTNLGRAPFGKDLLQDSVEILEGYNNLEFNLEKGIRGDRNDHASELLKFLTGAEDVLIVNNNAAAVMLILRAFAKRKEVIVSRGELIEIGGSFRIPEIMAASDCKMVEVGTTNKTNIEDYKKAITSKTAVLFKAHKSNYVIKGFTHEAGLEELSELGKQHNIPVLYDIGSGLLRNYAHQLFKDEPDVRQSLEKGADLICFSGDKLLGGPQAGIIAGKKELISKLKKEPQLRALRVGKETLALLETACMYYLNEKDLIEKNQIFKIISRKPEEIKQTALLLKKELEKSGIISEVTTSIGQCGGGTLPDGELESFSVMITNESPNKIRSSFSEKMFAGLLSHKKPVLGILKQGNIYFDVLTIFEEDISELASIISEINQSILKS